MTRLAIEQMVRGFFLDENHVRIGGSIIFLVLIAMFFMMDGHPNFD